MPKERMPHAVRPMLAKLVEQPFDRAGWVFEIKWDGFRAIAEIEAGTVRLYSRNGLSLAEQYPPVVQALHTIKHDCVLDGEIVALKNGHADFHTLKLYRERRAPLQFVVFDLLYLDGRDLRKDPLLVRKQLLRKVIPRRHRVLVYSDHFEDKGTALFAEMQRRQIEGMIAKDGASPYREGQRGGVAEDQGVPGAGSGHRRLYGAARQQQAPRLAGARRV